MESVDQATISIIIPFKNEALRLPHSLSLVDKYISTLDHTIELILVDDGSTDNTLSKIDPFVQLPYITLLKHEKNKGKGAAIQTGVMHARGNYILFSDADLSTPISELDQFLKHINDYDIVIGSRVLEQSKLLKRQPLYRRLIAKSGNLLIRTVLKLPYQDTQCGFKMFHHAIAKELFQDLKMSRFSFDFEVLYHAKKKSFSVKEAPVQWKDSQPSTFNPMQDTARSFVDLFRIWFYYR